MRDDKDHNERLDDFSGYMRQRLEEHRLPVDAGCWDEVEARMNRRARSIISKVPDNFRLPLTKKLRAKAVQTNIPITKATSINNPPSSFLIIS